MVEIIQRDDRNEVTIVTVPARLDAVLSESLNQMFGDLMAEGRCKVVVDCQHLEFLNSIVIGILVSFHQKATKKGGNLKFANVPLPVEDVLRLTKLDQVFKWYPSVDDAVATF
ncbi:MAG TPA: STAS domain-containing protein [bacterium]|nr:STAS domain-containing protein [bacterium]HPO09870.1 STAS domain-containing protein [bacterium]HQO36182.1 STAS domain-containing protein [bacterium]HQQ00508.1 STAS domain-containing protein [bacterium]